MPIEGPAGVSSATVTPGENGVVSMQVDNGDEEVNKRRKLLQEALELDKDDDDDDEEEEEKVGSEGGNGEGKKSTKGKAKDDEDERYALNISYQFILCTDVG